MPTLPRAAVPASESAPLVLTSTNLCRFYLPGRGLGYSFLIHGIVLTVVQLVPIVPIAPVVPVVDSLTEGFPSGQGATKGNGSGVRMVMYLPSIGGGRQGQGGGSESSGNQPTAAPSSGTEGLVYPGPQLMRSDSPQPTSRFQTLLQPELEDLPILKGRLALPNLLSTPEVPDTVKPEEEQPVDPSEGVVTEPVQAQLEDLPISKRRLEVPDLFLMPDVPDVDPSEGVATEPVQAQLEDLPIWKRHLDLSNLLSMPEVGGVPWSAPAHQAVGLPDTVKPEEPEPVDPSDGVTEPVQAELADLPFLKRRLVVPNLLSMLDLPSEEQQPLADLPFLNRRLDIPNFLSMLDLPKIDLPNILALTPMPTPLELPVEIPAGEARGRFTIAPESNLDTSETEPGSPSAVVPGDQAVGLAGENALSTSVVNITLGTGVGAKDKGSSSGGGGDVGPGSGTDSGTGSGAGSGP